MASAGHNGVFKIGGVEVCIARNITVNLEATEEDTTSRCDGGWRNGQQGLRRLTADVEMLYVYDNASLMAIKEAVLLGTSLAFEILDDNATGWSGNCKFFNLTEGQPLDDAMMFSTQLRSIGQVVRVGTYS